MKKWLGVVGIVVLFLTSASCSAGLFGRDRGAGSDDADYSVAQGSNVPGALRGRRWILHIPTGLDQTRPAPLLLVFHGGMGTGAKARKQTAFDPVADRKGFMVVYPDAAVDSWNDGRKTTRSSTDDVAFVAALIDYLVANYNVDRQRVYATGASNGGMMTQRLACDLADRIAAFAPVVANMPVPLLENCHPSRPVPILAIYGGSDPLMPPGGGEIRKGRRSGKGGTVISARKSIAFWADTAGCSTQPQRERLPDVDPDDGTRVDRVLYRGCRNGVSVEALDVEGGGHAWPGSETKGFIARRLMGVASRDIHGSEVIWQFLSRFRLGGQAK
ncbi:MAG: PHB depolymerase family esterase [Gammaproteobacteria bacterium]|nr:MAG: PHB depolymerase family esterase [Gammaproteobacteria bacterium]